MKALIDIIELAGGLVLLFGVGWIFARLTGYDKYYDKMMKYNDETKDQTIKNYNFENENDVDLMHHAAN